MEMTIQPIEQQKKSIFRNEKGLTLIELLAVIVILAIIAAIAIPAVTGIINKSKDKSNITNAHLIIDAARNKFSIENLIPSGATATMPAPVSLATLVSEGYIEAAPRDPNASSSSTSQTYDQAKTLVTVVNTAGVITYEITLVGADGKDIFAGTPESELEK